MARDGTLDLAEQVGGSLSATEDITGGLSTPADIYGSLSTPTEKIVPGDYELLKNKPTINTVEVEGDKTGADYRLQDKMQELSVSDIEKILYLG